MFVIAIDGPAASGKSSVSRLLADRMRCRYVNSGSFYRAVTWAAFAAGLPLHDEDTVTSFVKNIDIQTHPENGELVMLLNGEDPRPYLRDQQVNENVSLISSYPEVRGIITTLLRRLASKKTLVMEGRDIGSVVFPETPYKFYIDANEAVRASRRSAQGETDSIARRDAADSSRQTAPLVVSSDATVIDSSHLTLEGVVAEIVAHLRTKGMEVPG